MELFTQYWPRVYLTVAVTACVIVALAMPLWIYVLRKMGVIDVPAANKIHQRPIPRGGGVLLYVAFAVAVMLPGYRSRAFNGVMLGGFVCLVVGALDDFVKGGIPGIYKLFTLITVTFILQEFGVNLHAFQNKWLDMIATVLWVVGVTSAFNGIDNMDGLASGTAAIVSCAYLFIALQAWMVTHTETSLSWFGMLAAGLIGANLGFLAYNFKPACVFMGDSGSFFLGFMLAALGVMGEWTPNRFVSCTIPVILLGVPLFDFAYILFTRILKGQTRTMVSVVNHCATDHLSHRLVWMGFSQREAVLLIYLICVILGVTGILVRNSVDYLDSALGMLQAAAIFAIVVILMEIAARRYRSQKGDQIDRMG